MDMGNISIRNERDQIRSSILELFHILDKINKVNEDLPKYEHNLYNITKSKKGVNDVVNMMASAIQIIEDIEESTDRVYSRDAQKEPNYYLELLKNVLKKERKNAAGLHLFGTSLKEMKFNRNVLLSSLDVKV